MDMSNITVIIVNRWTLNLTRQCVESLLRFHPALAIILVDNKSGEGDPSLRYCESMAASHDNVTLIKNIHQQPEHGIGLNLGVSGVSTPLFLTVDSDVILQSGTVLSAMASPFADPQVFATGHVWRGAAWDCSGAPRPGAPTTDFVHPFFAMWNTGKFRDMRARFNRVGMPTCHVCKQASRRGYKLCKVQGIHPRNRSKDCIVRHLGGGTRALAGRKRK